MLMAWLSWFQIYNLVKNLSKLITKLQRSGVPLSKIKIIANTERLMDIKIIDSGRNL